jgi:hypothetical protein
MAVKVQTLLARFYQRVDPLTDDGVVIDESNVGTVDGQAFPAAEGLRIYNSARKTLAASLRLVVPTWFSTREVSGCLVRKDDLEFADGVADKPPGYVYCERLSDVDGNRIIITGLDRVGALKDFESAEKRYVLDIGNQFIAESGDEYIPDAATYILWYFGVLDWALSDVTGGTALETYDEIWLEHLLEVANLIAQEAGQAEITTLTLKFFNVLRAQLGPANG